MEAAGFEQREEVYVVRVASGDGARDGPTWEGVKTGSQQPFITPEEDGGAESCRMVNISR